MYTQGNVLWYSSSLCHKISVIWCLPDQKKICAHGTILSHTTLWMWQLTGNSPRSSATSISSFTCPLKVGVWSFPQDRSRVWSISVSWGAVGVWLISMLWGTVILRVCNSISGSASVRLLRLNSTCKQNARNNMAVSSAISLSLHMQY